MQPDFVLVDSHCHLDLEHFDDDRDEVVERAVENGVNVIVNPGIDLVHSRKALALADRFAEVYAAVGIHPTHCNGYTPKTLHELREMAAHPKAVAIGEIGLDYYWDQTTPEEQKLALRGQLSLAAEVGLPVIIHSRDSNADIAAELRAWVESSEFANSALAKRQFIGVLHAFSGDLALAEEAYSWGFLVSLGGPVTYRNAHDLHELAPKLRQDRLMLETDAPYLTPHPHRSQRNEPGYVRFVCEKMAELRGVPADVVAAESTAVAELFFALEIPGGVEVNVIE